MSPRQQPRRIARELALLSLSQIKNNPEKLEKEDANSLVLAAIRSAVCYTDFWKAYELVLPGKRHRAVGKESRETNHIERFNNTFRQRISRLVRKSLSFFKKRIIASEQSGISFMTTTLN